MIVSCSESCSPPTCCDSCAREPTHSKRALHPTPAFVAEDQLIVNVLEMAVDSPLPVAVVDAEERLVGVVPRVTLLAALASTTPETDQVDIIVPPDPVSTADINAALEATADSGEVSR